MTLYRIFIQRHATSESDYVGSIEATDILEALILAKAMNGKLLGEHDSIQVTPDGKCPGDAGFRRALRKFKGGTSDQADTRRILKTRAEW